MCTIIGIVVQREDTHNYNPSVKVIVTNHVTLLDHLAMDLVHPCILPGVWDLPKFLNWVLGYKDLGVKEGRDVLIQNAKRHVQESSISILAHPEGATTNGRIGLLKFSTWPFVIEDTVQPVLVTVSRPLFPNIAVTVLGSRWWSDLFWFLFVPWTIFTLKYLPVLKRESEESAEDFSQRVQSVMAHKLGQTATAFTCNDKVEYAKKVLREAAVPARPLPANRHSSQRSPSASPLRNPLQGGSELSRMALKVKEVLPHVPLVTIRDDLVKTRCVDVTIARLIEGVVSFVPEPQPLPNQQAKPSPTPQMDRESLSRVFASNGGMKAESHLIASSKSFGKTADERTRSYLERKELLIQNARLQYAQKHGLQL